MLGGRGNTQHKSTQKLLTKAQKQHKDMNTWVRVLLKMQKTKNSTKMGNFMWTSTRYHCSRVISDVSNKHILLSGERCWWELQRYQLSSHLCTGQCSIDINTLQSTLLLSIVCWERMIWYLVHFKRDIYTFLQLVLLCAWHLWTSQL